MKLSINGTVYHYEIYGNGVPFVLLHGFTGSIATWHPFIEKWQDTFQLILIDLPGHGETKMRDSFSMKQCCIDLHDLFKELNLNAIHLLGYSMGGRTALSFAMTYPEMVQTLVLESASPGLISKKEQDERIERDEKLADWIEKEGVEAFVDFWEDIPLFETQKALSKEKQQIIRDERLAQTPSELASSLRYMGTGIQPNWWNHLKDLTIPVLLLVGEWDRKFVGINQKMNDELLHSQFKPIAETGHAIHVEQPEKFGKIVTAFILNQNE